ncbi:MAG: hypothetical protein KDA41_11855, partial [Planctomycetales bacterium]|nr:hypothetical protein [Planctomycetales bacterium]
MTEQPRLFDTEPEPWELDDAAQQRVASVVFTEGVAGPYDYAVPADLAADVEPGRRVKAPLGRGNRLSEGWCVAVETKAHLGRALKEIHSVVDPLPLLDRGLLELTRWMAEYYLCDWGQAIQCAVPAGVRHQAGTREVTLLSVPTHVAARLTQLKLPKKQAAALKILAAARSPMTLEQLASAVE